MITIGRVGRPWTTKSARAECYKILGNIAAGHEPKRSRPGLTITELTTKFMRQYVTRQLKPNSIDLYRIIFEKHVLPVLGHKQACALSKADVIKLHDRLSVNAPIMANRAIQTLAAAYNWGIKKGLIDQNPVVGIDKNKEKMRERYLSVKEFHRLGEALRKLDKEFPSAVAAIILLVLTGCRLREILHLKWSEVDYQRGILFLADSKTGSKVVVLSEPAIRVLKEQPILGEYVIPGRDSTNPRSDLKRPWQRIIQEAKLDDFRVHDLRHSFASVGAGLSVGLPIIGKLLGHSQSRTTERYAHLAVDPLKQATNQIAERISGALFPNIIHKKDL
ncbi:MAG: tyrosine-type recombinase/integrase [Rhizobiaceae bacterium]